MQKNRKIKFLVLIVSVLFLATGCAEVTFTYNPSDRVVEYNPKSKADTTFSFTATIDEKYDNSYLIVINDSVGCKSFYIKTGNTVTPFEWSSTGKSIASLKKTHGEKLTFVCVQNYYNSSNEYDGSFRLVIETPKENANLYEQQYENHIFDTEDFTIRPKSSSSGSTQSQSIQTGVESELLNKIGGIKEYCNYEGNFHYNQLASSANMFSKIAYSQVNCATTKYSSSYDNGISFINWVFEKNGASTRLPSTYNEVITWAGNKMFTADAKGTNIQAGDLVILGSDSTSPIEIVVQVNSNRIKTVGYKTSGNNKVIYETSHSDMLNGKRIIKMSGVSY